MSIEDFLKSDRYTDEKKEMPIICDVIEMMSDKKPFQDIQIALGHFIALNSVTLWEGLWRGGANVIICTPFESKQTYSLLTELEANNFPINSVENAVNSSDYFVDNAGALGLKRTPTAAVEVTRTGDFVYKKLECPTISIDKSRLKYIEDYLGTGESFVRGWNHFNPDDALIGKQVIIFGYGKVGKGVAYFSRKAGANVSIVDINPEILSKAEKDGYIVVDPNNRKLLEASLKSAEVIIGVTGKPGAVGDSVPSNWLRANSPVFVNIGHDEFGPEIPDNEIIGGRSVPINFHLDRPTKNYKIDPIQSAEILALEDLILNADRYQNGIHPLPSFIDEWIMSKWVSLWPEDDLSGIKEELEKFG